MSGVQKQDFQGGPPQTRCLYIRLHNTRPPETVCLLPPEALREALQQTAPTVHLLVLSPMLLFLRSPKQLSLFRKSVFLSHLVLSHLALFLSHLALSRLSLFLSHLALSRLSLFQSSLCLLSQSHLFQLIHSSPDTSSLFPSLRFHPQLSASLLPVRQIQYCLSPLRITPYLSYIKSCTKKLLWFFSYCNPSLFTSSANVIISISINITRLKKQENFTYA